MISAGDVVLCLGLVGQPERERRLELGERARRVSGFEIQLAGARVPRRLEGRDVEAKSQRLDGTRAVALFEPQGGEPAERLQVRLVVLQKRLKRRRGRVHVPTLLVDVGERLVSVPLARVVRVKLDGAAVVLKRAVEVARFT